MKYNTTGRRQVYTDNLYKLGGSNNHTNGGGSNGKLLFGCFLAFWVWAYCTNANMRYIVHILVGVSASVKIIAISSNNIENWTQKNKIKSKTQAKEYRKQRIAEYDRRKINNVKF